MSVSSNQKHTIDGSFFPYIKLFIGRFKILLRFLNEKMCLLIANKLDLAQRD